MTEIQLTQKQQYWLDHVIKADAENIPLIVYAKRHNLNLKLFYNMRSILRQKGVLPPVVNDQFVPVSVSTVCQTSLFCRICLPNGVVFELPIPAQQNELSQLLSSASQL